MKEIKPFYNAFKDIQASAGTNGSGRKQIIGYLCSYVPEEIILAAGHHPLRLFSSKPEIMLAENHLQSYCCSTVRGVLEDSLKGNLDFLDGIVFPHTCDSIQRMSDIFRMNGKYNFFADILLPAKLNTTSARDYMIKVLEKLKTDIENKFSIEISNADLQRSIKLMNRIRQSLMELYVLAADYSGIITGTELFTVTKGSMIMDRERAADLLADILTGLDKSGYAQRDKKPVILSGSTCDFPDIYEAIEMAGGTVAGDDLCTGMRWFDTKIDEDMEPLEAIAQRLQTRSICPAKHSGLDARAGQIKALAKNVHARGVIFILLKFCDPHAFDYPYLKESLEKQGLKTLLIEMDEQQLSKGQLSTRIETFIHML